MFTRFITLFFLTMILSGQRSDAQTVTPSDKFVLWKGVKIYEFEYAGYPDTLAFCYGEWIIKGKAKSLNKLSKRVLNEIVKKVKEDNCNVVFVDLKNYWETKEAWPNGIYCLGLKEKK